MNEDRQNKIIKLYQDNISLAAICRRCGVSQTTVYAVLKSNDIPRRGQLNKELGPTAEQKAKWRAINKMRKQRFTWADIGIGLEISAQAAQQFYTKWKGTV